MHYGKRRRCQLPGFSPFPTMLIKDIFLGIVKSQHCMKSQKSSLIELCSTPLSTVFQSYHGESSHYSRLSWVSPVLGRALKCLAQGHSHEKTQRIQCGSNPGPLDYESNTLPLSHVGPSLCEKELDMAEKTEFE